MSKNKAAPHPYIYQRFDKPSKFYSPWYSESSIFDKDAWGRLGFAEWRDLYQNQWIPSPIGFTELAPFDDADYHRLVWRAFAIPRPLFEPRGYNCPCVLDRTSEKLERRVLTDKEILSSMRLSLILIKEGLSTWGRFFELYPLALDYIEIRLAYQDYVIKQILKAPSRLWQWLKRKAR